MTRYIYKSVSYMVPINLTGVNADKMTEGVDRITNSMAEEGWRLVGMSVASSNSSVHLFVFERPAVSPSDNDR